MDDWEALGAVPREQGRHTGLINRPHSLGSFGSGTVGGRGRGRGRGWHGGRARGRGGRSGEGRPYQVRLGFKALEELDTKAPDEIILDLTSTRCFPATESLLQQSGMMDDMVVLITSILAKACACSSKEYLIKLLNLLPKSPFFALHLRTFLNRISACRMPATNIATFLNNVIKIMNELLRRFPNCYADLPVAELYCGVMFWSNTEQIDGNQVDGNSLLKDAEELFKLRTQKAEDLKKREEEKQSRRRPRRDAGLHDDDDPPDDFRTLSVIPTQADVLSGERPFLRRNKVDGSYNSSEHYLDVQFRLLREDFVRPLREGIAQLLERIGSPKIGALQDIRVYKDVQILYPICTSNGLQYKVKFDNTRLRNVRWENSKRLIFGSLMCLSKDKFESFVFATVANRDVKDLKQGIVQMQFINLSDMLRLESGDVYQMVESTVYFEAYRHILEGLKEVDPARLPLQKYIVNCEKDVEAPAYLRNRFRERVTFDLTPIMRGESRNVGPSPSGSSLLRLRFASLNLRDNSRGKGTNVPILNLAAWPTAEDLELDNSQYRAIKMALTKEFAVIQGPPGTGKTYLGLKIANVLLHNKSKWDTGTEHLDGDIDERYLLSERRPILVVCYTNHALDQFLEGIHKLHPQGIVRVGGRSQSEVMQACSLSELKHKMHKEKKIPLHIRRAYYDAHQEMEHTTASLENAAEDLKRCHENVIHEDDIRRRAPSMTDTLYHSLKADLLQADSRNSVMLHWLQLSWNPGVGASAQPVAVFPLNQMVQGLERISRGNVATFSRRTAWALDQNRSVQLLGSPDSYIEIPNLPGSDLDTRTSITLLMHVFPSGNRGSIISFQENGLGVQIWQEGMVDGKGILTARFTWRDFSQPPGVSKAVLNMNAWNFIGASYDHDSGFARLWHQGNVVETKFIGRKMELATQFSIRIGALADSGRGDCFRGMVADLHIFAESLGRDAVRAVGGIVSQAGAEAEEEQHDSFGEEEEEEAEDQDVLYEAAAMQDMRVLDNDDVRVFRAKQVAALKGRLKVVHIDLGGSVDPDGFQLNNPKRLRRKLKSTIIQELSKKDVMPDGRVRMIRNVWSLNIKDRWRLYRRWVADISESYRHTISLYQEQFEAGAKKMKDIRNLEDFEILKNADVVGLTTTGTCSSCLRGRVHQPCRSICTRILFCGHSCSEPCTKNCPPCKKPCGNSCKHSKCKQKCGEPCKPCNEPCIWKCQHHKCTKLCSEPCNRKRCDQPCKKRLPCKHLCIGLCGENCPKKCRVCHKDEVTEIFFGTEDDPNARFVELADCGHFFEVEMMDNWMDQAQQTDDGKAVDVQLKCCPKCSTPIRTSLRYGNIIKKILADFEEIKKKILLGEEQRRAVVSRLRLKARKIVKFPEDQGKLMRALEHSSLTDEQVNVYENQISFLRFLQELKDKIEKGIDDDSERATKSHLVYVPLETKEDIQIMVEELRKRVMETRARFSEQELEELNEEMYRTQLAVDVKLLKMQIKVRGISLDAVYSSSLDRIQKRVDSEKAIALVNRRFVLSDQLSSGFSGKDDRERYTTRIEMIRRRHNLTVFYQDVTRQEKDLIVKAMGLTQGHWFKCPKGHIYCITECGGAMEEGRCPECGSSIGGRNHQLRADNRLASEMDGARYAAFSDLANINNFDPRDFM
ncbi:NFX1-type zinc finger-containing protein 1-like isoform X4 [Montipora capricornis]|uniref:NFX1-type zinc finger-containing protein 1-like isoform X4 n=1 Tax=Montipora capricornis TaxID=246305 RepID=UPI0035F1E8F0